MENKYSKVGGSVPPKQSFATDSRQQKRKREFQDALDILTRRFAGQGRGGNLQWPLELCPRSRRRSIVHDAAVRKMRESV